LESKSKRWREVKCCGVRGCEVPLMITEDSGQKSKLGCRVGIEVETGIGIEVEVENGRQREMRGA